MTEVLRLSSGVGQSLFSRRSGPEFVLSVRRSADDGDYQERQVQESMCTERPPRVNALPIALIVVSDMEYGGAQRQVVELANHLYDYRYRVHVCSLSEYVPLAVNIRERDSRFHFAPRCSRFDWTVVPRLGRLIRELKADLVHGFLFDAEIASRLAGRWTRRPVIGSERNTNYEIKRSDFIAYKATGWARDLTIANSSAGADFNSRVFGLPRTSYRVVHNGVDANRFVPGDGTKMRDELGVAHTSPLVGMFGSFKPQKNHPCLLRAAKHVLARLPATRFLFVGDELHKGGSESVAYKQNVQDLINELGLRPHCIFAGNRQDVERYYPACDITVLPSLFEGTPNVALESMACGVPVVATNVSDNSYVIPDGKCGFIVLLNSEETLADRIVGLLRNGELRKSMGQTAREWVVQEFSPKRLADKTADVYDEVIRMKGKKKEMA